MGWRRFVYEVSFRLLFSIERMHSFCVVHIMAQSHQKICLYACHRGLKARNIKRYDFNMCACIYTHMRAYKTWMPLNIIRSKMSKTHSRTTKYMCMCAYGWVWHREKSIYSIYSHHILSELRNFCRNTQPSLQFRTKKKRFFFFLPWKGSRSSKKNEYIKS